VKAFRAREVTPLLVADRGLMERWKQAAAEEKLVARSRKGENWVLVLDEELARDLVARGLSFEEWEEA